jgi:hypothetical protein
VMNTGVIPLVIGFDRCTSGKRDSAPELMRGTSSPVTCHR